MPTTLKPYSSTNPQYQSFTTDFGTSGKISGTYSGVEIINADQYGGADGTGQYAVAFGGGRGASYSLTLNTPVNYFGYWLSALDKGNVATFYGANNQVLFQFNPQDVLNAISKSSNPNAYYGNPNAPFKGKDSTEPFVFLNFFDTTGTFTKVVFSEVGNGTAGYESDNHTVGTYASVGSGTFITLTNSAAPEPAAWALMMVGVGGMGAALRTRRRKAIAAA